MCDKNYINHLSIYLIYYYHVCVYVYPHVHMSLWGWEDGCVHVFVHVCMCVNSRECMCSCLGVYMEVKGQLSRVKFQETSNSGHVTCVAGAR